MHVLSTCICNPDPLAMVKFVFLSIIIFPQLRFFFAFNTQCARECTVLCTLLSLRSSTCLPAYLSTCLQTSQQIKQNAKSEPNSRNHNSFSCIPHMIIIFLLSFFRVLFCFIGFGDISTVAMILYTMCIYGAPNRTQPSASTVLFPCMQFLNC